ncbi:hypothetical protein Tco_0031717 [Tanacetum coccineum]
MSGSPEPRRGRSKSPRERGPKRKTVFKRLENGVFHRLGDKEKSVSAHSRDSRHRPYHSSHRDTKSCYQSSRSRETEFASKKHHNKRTSSRRTEALSKSEGSAGGHWKSKPKKQKSRIEDDLSQPWVYEETDPFTPRIHYFNFPKTRIPSHIKTYNGSEDLEDHLKIFQSAAKTEHWAMPTWCHMFNSTLTGNAKKKCIKDPVEIHNIKERYGESTEEFVRRYKLECSDVKGAPECMKISGFMYGITNPGLIKRLHDKISKSVDEMMRVTTAFLRGEVAASNCERKKSFSSWKQQEAGLKQNFKKGGFQNQQRPKLKQDRFTLLTKTPKEILALDKGKFKPPPPMTTLVEKRNASKFCEFHGEVGHTTDECMHLKRKIEEMLKAGKLSHLIKELKQSNGKDQAKTTKNRETLGKDKSLAILTVQPWHKVAKQKFIQTFSPELVISFPPLGEEDGTEGPIIIKAEMGGHCVHRMYMDEGSSSKILYEYCFNRFRPEVRNQMIPATTPLVGFSGEIIWSLGKISLLNYRETRGKENPGSSVHSPRNAKIPNSRRSGYTTEQHDHSTRMHNGFRTRAPQLVINQVTEEKIQVAIHSEYPEQTIAIGSTLTEEGRKELCGLLRRNLYIFVWKPPDMTGVPWHIAEHMLNIREGCLPVGQKKKGQAPERNKAIYEVVEKLVDADIIKKSITTVAYQPQ